ncbi:MAG: hypothetical protein AB1556_11660 [Bacillota bacterium]
MTGDTTRLAERFCRECQSILGIRPDVKVLPPGTLPRATHKAKRVLDLRKETK